MEGINPLFANSEDTPGKEVNEQLRENIDDFKNSHNQSSKIDQDEEVEKDKDADEEKDEVDEMYDEEEVNQMTEIPELNESREITQPTNKKTDIGGRKRKKRKKNKKVLKRKNKVQITDEQKEILKKLQQDIDNMDGNEDNFDLENFPDEMKLEVLNSLGLTASASKSKKKKKKSKKKRKGKSKKASDQKQF